MQIDQRLCYPTKTNFITEDYIEQLKDLYKSKLITLKRQTQKRSNHVMQVIHI